MTFTMRFISPVLAVVGLAIALAVPAEATFPGKNGRIAFILGPDVYTMNPDGSDVKQLTNLGPDSGAFWESWSPNGGQIVFNEFRPPDFLGQIWVMNTDGSNQHLLFAEPDFDDQSPSFTSDGSSVIFNRCHPDHDQGCALYQIGLNGTGLRAITDFELGIQDFSPQYSPYNGSLAFTSFGRGGIIGAIYLTTADGSGPSRLTAAPLSARQPDWSPDGKTIAFSTHCCNPQNQEIWVASIEGGGLRPLTNNGTDYFAGPHDFHPSWSPQGDAIVFERDAPDLSSSAIFIMKADGSGPTKLISLGPPARPKGRARKIQQQGNHPLKHRPREIEEGGVLPQWGVAPN
jgi:Tol biopolymer transport system component